MHEIEVLSAMFTFNYRRPRDAVCFVGDSHFIEERRKSLRRRLILVARHPAINDDPLVNFFLTYRGADAQHKIPEVSTPA